MQNDGMIMSKTCIKCGDTLVIGTNWSTAKMKCYLYNCSKCDAVYRKTHSTKISKHLKDYYDRVGREKLGQVSMYENKTCASYLGVVVAEQVLSKVFKNITRMPNGCPGYDFICSKGMKIDVKSGCITNRGGWQFNITKNKTADYFLCLAFDNRTDLNPLYIWLIPGDEINRLFCATIAKTTIPKWSKYMLDINKVIDCCSEMRSDI